MLGSQGGLPATRAETLASGNQLWHMNTATTIVAVVQRGDSLLTVVADRPDGAPIDDYLPAIGQLIETVK